MTLIKDRYFKIIDLDVLFILTYGRYLSFAL